MAEKRMFTQKIIDSDAFLDMPLSTQALYFHLNMRADDDGFINNPKRIQRTVGASEDDLKLLLAKRFAIGFENGVIVIKHWRMHNTLRKDRYNPTQYQEQFLRLRVKENNAYTDKPVNHLATRWQPDGNQMEPQISIVENSIVERSIEEYIAPESDDSEAPSSKPSKPKKQKHGQFQNVRLADEELESLKNDFGSETCYKAIDFLDAYIEEKGYKSKSHNLAIRRWVMDAIKEREKGQAFKKSSGNQAAQQLEDSYNMMANWATKGSEVNG